MSTRLKHALVDHNEAAWRVAQRMGIQDVRLSKIARGHTLPRNHEKVKLSEILGKTAEELFPEKTM